MMPLTTRQGDAGWTRDAAGRRVSKDDVVIEAYGALDELSCMLGWLGIACPEPERRMVVRWQAGVSEVLAGMCGGAGPAPDLVQVLEANIAHLLPEPPAGFVTPGGSEASCRAHLARDACRKAERRVVAAMGHECAAIPVLNRLSDALFALAVSLDRPGSVPSG